MTTIAKEPLSADPAPQLENARQKIEAEFRREVAAEDRSRALADARELLDQLEAGSVLRRLRELGDAVIARELPIQCAPEPEGSGAVGFVGGAVDLVYRDPTTTEWVVADYKTDRVASPEELRERADGYAAQGRAYTHGLRQALRLDHTPRFELWFLRADTIIVQAAAQD